MQRPVLLQSDHHGSMAYGKAIHDQAVHTRIQVVQKDVALRQQRCRCAMLRQGHQQRAGRHILLRRRQLRGARTLFCLENQTDYVVTFAAAFRVRTPVKHCEHIASFLPT